MPEDLGSILEVKSRSSVEPQSSVISPAANTGTTPSAASNQFLALMKRYKDAYIVARVTNGFGKVIKAIGIGIAILLVIIGFVVAGQRSLGETAVVLGVGFIAFGVIMGVWFFIVGVLVSAQGQILRASLDSAVNNSPFLTNDHRAKIMSLPEA